MEKGERKKGKDVGIAEEITWRETACYPLKEKEKGIGDRFKEERADGRPGDSREIVTIAEERAIRPDSVRIPKEKEKERGLIR